MTALREALRKATGCDSPFDPRAKAWLKREAERLRLFRAGRYHVCAKLMQAGPERLQGRFALSETPDGGVYEWTACRRHGWFWLESTTNIIREHECNWYLTGSRHGQA